MGCAGSKKSKESKAPPAKSEKANKNAPAGSKKLDKSSKHEEKTKITVIGFDNDAAKDSWTAHHGGGWGHAYGAGKHHL